MARKTLIVLMCLFFPIASESVADVRKGKDAFDRCDFKTALKEFQEDAEKGDPESQNRIGLLYWEGKGTTKDCNEAMKWFQRAAEKGHAEAQLHIGEMYQGGEGVKSDYAEALKWYRKAAEQGNAEGQWAMFFMYGNGCGVPIGTIESRKWLRKAAEQGHVGAQLQMGVDFWQGLGGVEKDPVQAYLWLSLAAASGDGEDAKTGANGRDAVAEEMTPEQIAAAKKLISTWKAKK